ncbi:hypothetical protein TSOC_008310 [Tetrabaena socialis]|uniref:DSBA-like thioredoxin domain-containing protein n=1 Tax=Tetrabaena socialis TaxID=47790 RepID=A0A2J7ZYT2_9CHLO|nr:hypothetical protein TSOC_008312 [Tetrabaena socialis]PNH05431.1 hypothetical protein TSOC_008310 [Tetrabaena socialis]|eukprot:PNH05429.1 hypothetical protein TSOC_008312 [Tetrabaena socialis]
MAARMQALMNHQRGLPIVTINLFSDVACPWCYVGTRRMKRALGMYKRQFGNSAPVKLVIHPVQANVLEPSGQDVASYWSKHEGGGGLGLMKSRLQRAGLPEGAAFANWRTVPSTLLAHELLLLASSAGLAEQINDLLFARTYEQGANVSELGELLDIAEAVGMQRDFVRQELTRGEGGPLARSVVQRDAAAKKRLRIKAVPHFIIAAGPSSRTKYSLDGAQQSSDLMGAMQAVAMQEARGPATAGSRQPSLAARPASVLYAP